VLSAASKSLPEKALAWAGGGAVASCVSSDFAWCYDLLRQVFTGGFSPLAF
jgi:hypothetical protein